MDENNTFNPGGFNNQPGFVPEEPGKNILPDKKTVEVPVEDLQKLLERVERVEKENVKLTEIADRGRLAHWEQTHKGASPKIYHVSTYLDKIITSWEMTMNQVFKDPKTNVWQEKQEIEITTEDGKKVKLPYPEFVSNTHKLRTTLISTTQKGDKTYLEVQTDSGKKLIIDSVFIN